MATRGSNRRGYYSAWKENFRKPYKIARNYREGDPEVLTIEISYDYRQPEIGFNNDKIVAARGENLYVFCASSGKLLRELVGHTRDVVAIQVHDQFIVSNSNDGSIKVWDVDMRPCFHTLDGYITYVRFPVYTRSTFRMHGTIAVSYENFDRFRVWDVRDGRCIKIFTGHYPMNQLLFDGKRIVSASDRDSDRYRSWVPTSDGNIYIWNPQTGMCLRTLIGNYLIMALKFNGVVVVAGYETGTIKVWEVDTGVCRHSLGENSPLYLFISIYIRSISKNTAWD